MNGAHGAMLLFRYTDFRSREHARRLQAERLTYPIECPKRPSGYPRLTTAKSELLQPSRPEEYEPDDAQDENCEPGRNGQQREHRRSGFGLARLGRGFDDLAMSLRCHGDLFK